MKCPSATEHFCKCLVLENEPGRSASKSFMWSYLIFLHFWYSHRSQLTFCSFAPGVLPLLSAGTGWLLPQESYNHSCLPAPWSNHPAHGYTWATGTLLSLQLAGRLNRFQHLVRLLVQQYQFKTCSEEHETSTYLVWVNINAKKSLYYYWSFSFLLQECTVWGNALTDAVLSMENVCLFLLVLLSFFLFKACLSVSSVRLPFYYSLEGQTQKKCFSLIPMNIIEINGSLHAGALSTIQMFVWLVVLLSDKSILKVSISSKLNSLFNLSFPFQSL